MSYILGQVFGLIATVACIIVPLFKHKWQMLLNIIAVNLLSMLNFILIGQMGPAALLCAVATVQSVFSMVHTLREHPVSLPEKLIFLALYILLGFAGLVTAPGFVWELSLHNLVELLPICGALMSMCFVFVRDEQKARYFLLATSSIWALYAAIVGATMFFAQGVSILTTLGAMYKYRKTRRPASNA